MRAFVSGLLAICCLALTPAWAAVELNSATQSELESLKGVGPSKARAIIEYRAKHGPFKRIEDLDKVTGFGPATVEKLKGQVMVRRYEFRPAATAGVAR